MAEETPAEAQARQQENYRFEVRHLKGPPIRVDTEAGPDELAQLTARIESTWSEFGRTDAHWSVITQERFRAGSIDDTREEFYQTGEHTVGNLEAVLARHGVALADLPHVTDYGCGVGRVSAAIARRGPAVTAVDISAEHLDFAAQRFRQLGLERARTCRLAALSDIDALPETDLFFSVIVLQHNPPPMIAEILRRALSRVRAGGLAHFQVPTYHPDYVYDLKGDLAGRPGQMEMHVMPQEAVFALLDAAGFVPLEVRPEPSVGNPRFESHLFLARRRAAGATTPAEGDHDG